MKLHNYTLKYLSIAMLLIISIWAVVFYVNMLDEIYDSIDDGLENYKYLIIERAQQDSAILYKSNFNESNYSIKEITEAQAVKMRDVYRDTLMYMKNEQDFESVRILTTAFERNGRFYELNVISSMVEEDDLMEDLFFALLWLYIILLIVIFIVNTFLLKKIWKPFYTILQRLSAYQLGKDGVIEDTPSQVKEFRELNNTVVSMLKRNVETFNNQKQFTENAAHELQTPLAIAINKLELLVEKNELNEGQVRSVGEVVQILERLTQINKSLLLLSKIENKQFLDKEEITINHICQQLIESYQDLADFKGVKIHYVENGVFSQLMNKDLAVIFISNLLKNAIVHNISDGQVTITVSAQSISICNTGHNVSLDSEKLFNRFYKGEQGQNGTGLGLSLVKAIADLYGFTIFYSFNNEHCFTVNKS